MSFKILGKDLNPNAGIKYALVQSIFGIGPYQADRICDTVCGKLNIKPYTKIKSISESDLIEIQNAIQDLGIEVEGALRRSILEDNRNLQRIRCYRWLCRERGVPCRGQRSRSNGNTAHRFKAKTI